MQNKAVVNLPFYADKTDIGHVEVSTITSLFESEPKPNLQDNQSRLPIYLANIPLNEADPNLNVVAILEKIRDEVFSCANVDIHERDISLSRLCVVIGINRRMSLVDDFPIPTISASDRGKMNALPFHVVIVRFLWKPSFSFTQNGLAEIETDYLDSFHMAKHWCDHHPNLRAEVVNFEKNNIKSSMIPYGEIRNTIATYYSTQHAGFQLRQRNPQSPLYFLMLDADMKSLILESSNGLLRYFEKRLLEPGLRDLTLFAGGFRINPQEGFMQSQFAKLVLMVQNKIAEILPRGIYYSEANCLIYLPPGTHSLLESFSPGRGEMKGLVQRLLKRQNPQFIFDIQAAITTTLPTRMKKEFLGYEKESKFVGWKLSDITHLRGISQSPLKPMSWAHMIYDALPKLKITDAEKSKNIRTRVSSHLSKLFSLSDPFSVLDKIFKDAEMLQNGCVVTELSRIVTLSKSRNALKDFINDLKEFNVNCSAIKKIYGDKILNTILDVLNVTRKVITEFIDGVFCLDVEQNNLFFALNGLNDIDSETLEKQHLDLRDEIQNGKFTMPYLNQKITNTLTRMHVLVAFDDVESIEMILAQKKWQTLPNKAAVDNGITPFALALNRGSVDIAALYIIKNNKLLDGIAADMLFKVDQWGRCLLHTAVLQDDEKAFNCVLNHFLINPSANFFITDNFGHSIYDALVISNKGKMARDFLTRIQGANQIIFEQDHAFVLENPMFETQVEVVDSCQYGIKLLDLAILNGNYLLVEKLVEEYSEVPREHLDDEDNLTHLTSIETCFYLCSSSPENIWPTIIALLGKSSQRIFYLINSDGQNIFHLCAQWGEYDHLIQLLSKFSEFTPEMEEDQANEFLVRLLTSQDVSHKTPFTCIIDRFIKEKDFNFDFFTKFMIFENMKSRNSVHDSEISDNGIPYLFKRISIAEQAKIILIIKACLKLDSEFATQVFRMDDENQTYLSILMTRGFKLPYSLIEMFDPYADLFEDNNQIRCFLKFEDEGEEKDDEEEWNANYPRFKRLYLECVKNFEDIADDCDGEMYSDNEDDFAGSEPQTRSHRLGESPDIDRDPDYEPDSDFVAEEVPVNTRKRERECKSARSVDREKDVVTNQGMKLHKKANDSLTERNMTQSKLTAFWSHPSGAKKSSSDTDACNDSSSSQDRFDFSG